MQKALQDLRHAQQNFDNAEDNFLEAAIFELKAAEEKYQAKLREVKSNGAKGSDKKAGRIKELLSRIL